MRLDPLRRLHRPSSHSLRTHTDAFVALPGGIGTLDDVLEVMVANQLGLVRDRSGANQSQGKPMILLNLGGYYNPFLAQLDAMRAEGLLRSVAGLCEVATVEDCMATIAGMTR